MLSTILLDWYSIFYWLTVSDKVIRFFDVASTIFTVFAILSFIAYLISTMFRANSIYETKSENSEEESKSPYVRSWEYFRKKSGPLFYTFLALSIITWIGYVATPSKTDCLLIIAGGSVGNFVTTDSSSQQIPKDITKFLHISLQKEISELDADARKELGLQTPKEKLIDKVKNLSQQELIKFIEGDTSIVK